MWMYVETVPPNCDSLLEDCQSNSGQKIIYCWRQHRSVNARSGRWTVCTHVYGSGRVTGGRSPRFCLNALSEEDKLSYESAVNVISLLVRLCTALFLSPSLPPSLSLSLSIVCNSVDLSRSVYVCHCVTCQIARSTHARSFHSRITIAVSSARSTALTWFIRSFIGILLINYACK